MIRYNLDLLIQTAEQNDCIIDIEYYKKINVNRNTEICFICNCGNIYFKVMRQFYKFPLCKLCTNRQSSTKRKNTSLEKYGSESHLQVPEIKEKIKQTMLERYGCEFAQQNIEIREKTKQTNLEKYGCESNLQNEEIKEQIKKTNLKKYGCEFPVQNEEIKEKIKQTNLEKYGCIAPVQNEEVKEKMKQTMLEKYGHENPMQNADVVKKAKNTNLEKYGCENPMQNADIVKKVKNTNLEKYGCENPMQNADIAEKMSKNAYKLKYYIFPCGNNIQCQGYEPFAFDILIKNGYTYNDIIVKKTEIPEIWYEKDNKKHRYYCDIYITKEQRIIEVKSTWTYLKDKEDLQLKQQACTDNNYKFELWIFDKNANLIKEDEMND